ncbi:calcium-responsive transcription factor [Hydra vulgaris]|uniref:calcium-responsive transcription factor n=1 Tax=Hydra vulgaris TaxID=6087 RepID=UPI001F5F2597|nr:calcium-responsive transcription factor-like [Hydra vulgaris]XP_047134260.1 calcium-responsive transcription factor-like [Hydra vulgaris]
MASVESKVPVTKHVFATYADVCAKIAEHEMLHTVHYVVTCTGSMEKNYEELFKKEHKLFYEDKDFSYTGVPFIVSTRATLDCQHGKDRNIKKKAQYRIKKDIEASTDHYCRKNRVILQDTKKFDCPAMVYIKEIIEFPEFKVSKNTVRLRKETSKKLRLALVDPEILLKCRKYILVLPDISVHKNHAVGDNAGISQPISENIIVKIADLVKKGVNTVSEMRRHLEFFVQAEFTANNNLQSANKRYFPIDETIRNHMLNARRKLRRSLIDQECLHDKISEWQIIFQEAMIKFRPKGVNMVDDPELKDSLLFIYQDVWQKRLLLRYGNELIFLDATYRTTRYALPLFFLVVKTNIDYQVVAIFVCENETTSAITEALLCIKEWNPTFQPKFCLITQMKR